MKNKHLVALFLCICLLGVGCSKKSDTTTTPSSTTSSTTGSTTTPAPTIMQFHVTDAIGNAVASATIDLYNNQNDYTNLANVVATQTTDNSGNASFSGVQANTYYFNIYRKNDCQTNAFGAITTTSPLTSNQTNSFNIVLDRWDPFNLTIHLPILIIFT